MNATIDLEVRDPAIHIDSKIFAKLLKTARASFAQRSREAPTRTLPTLYKRYRGTGFPLTEADGAPLKDWRYRTQWMKAQVASLCLHEGPSVPFKVHLHDELREELTARKADLKVYLRTRLARELRKRFGEVPRFHFAIENRSKSGLSATLPHVHGEIAILPGELRTRKDGSLRMNSVIQIRAHGELGARLRVGRDITYEAMQAASGNDGKRDPVYGGRGQLRNVWVGKRYHPLTNEDWISYMLKNKVFRSRALPDNRYCMSRELNQEAQRLWNLIAQGESAIDQWM